MDNLPVGSQEEHLPFRCPDVRAISPDDRVYLQENNLLATCLPVFAINNTLQKSKKCVLPACLVSGVEIAQRSDARAIVQLSSPSVLVEPAASCWWTV